MRLADDDITIIVGGEAIRLRPTLRAAVRLERRHGFSQLFRDIVDGKLTTYADLIGEFASLPYIEAKVWDAGLDSLKPSLLAFVLALAGSDDEAPADDDGPRISHAEYHAKLYRIATGWLGWTPETAWESTPTEILEAYRGRIEMLRAVFGGGDGKPADPMPLDEKFKLAFRSLGARVGARRSN